MVLTLHVNGQSHHIDTPPDRTLLRVLREDLGLTGAKEGCSTGECGACIVLANGRPVNACLMLAPTAGGMVITTVEGLAVAGRLTALQQAFVEQDAVQCGFCTPGMLMSATALLQKNPAPDEAELRNALAGNLCRCTGYHRIFAAVQTAAGTKGHPPGLPGERWEEV